MAIILLLTDRLLEKAGPQFIIPLSFFSKKLKNIGFKKGKNPESTQYGINAVGNLNVPRYTNHHKVKSSGFLFKYHSCSYISHFAADSWRYYHLNQVVFCRDLKYEAFYWKSRVVIYRWSTAHSSLISVLNHKLQVTYMKAMFVTIFHYIIFFILKFSPYIKTV